MENFDFLKTNNLVLGLMIIGLVFWVSGVQNNGPLKTFAVPEISIGDAVTAIARGATVIDVRGRTPMRRDIFPMQSRCRSTN